MTLSYLPNDREHVRFQAIYSAGGLYEFNDYITSAVQDDDSLQVSLIMPSRAGALTLARCTKMRVGFSPVGGVAHTTIIYDIKINNSLPLRDLTCDDIEDGVQVVFNFDVLKIDLGLDGESNGSEEVSEI